MAMAETHFKLPIHKWIYKPEPWIWPRQGFLAPLSRKCRWTCGDGRSRQSNYWFYWYFQPLRQNSEFEHGRGVCYYCGIDRLCQEWLFDAALFARPAAGAFFMVVVDLPFDLRLRAYKKNKIKRPQNWPTSPAQTMHQMKTPLNNTTTNHYLRVMQEFRPVDARSPSQSRKWLLKKWRVTQ